MENFSYHLPFYVVTGGVKLSGHSSELQGGGVGLYDRSTWSVATSIGNGKEFFFAQGTIGGKDWYGRTITETTHKSPFFFGKDVTNMYLSRPRRIQNEEWVLGFNGSPSSKGLIFEKGKAVRVRLYFHGDPIYRFFGGPKEYVVSYTPLVDCTAPCNGSDCPEALGDCLTHTQALIDNINNHPELPKFGVHAKLVNTPFVAGSVNMEKYSLSLCDNGDVISLQQVASQYPTVNITRIARSGSTSTYNFCQPVAAAAPADYTQTGSVSLAVCGVCPSGSTLSIGSDTYFISRPIVGGEDFSTSNSRSTYAAGVATSYFPAVTFDGATAVEVVASSDAITITSHKFVTGEKVTYANGGGTSIVGLTTATDYFIINASVNTIKLATTAANALAGTAIPIADGVGSNHTLTPKVTSSFVSNNGGNALIKVEAPTGVVVTAVGADTPSFGFTSSTVCAFNAPAAVAWTLDADGGISSRRTLRINGLNRPDCAPTGNRLADLTTILTGVQGIDLTTLTQIAGVACADDYTVAQDSLDCLAEDCLTNNVTFTYDDLPAYDSHSWEVVPPVVTEDDTRKCGIRITAGYIDPQFGNCSFQVSDFYETEPIKMEVSLLVEDADNCDFALAPSQQQTRIGSIARQSGEWVVREVIMKTEAYQKHMMQFSSDPRMREAFDMNLLGMVDRKAFYDLYYVSYKASYGVGSWRKNEAEQFTTVFAFKQGDAAAKVFEANVLDVLTAKSGVAIHVNA